MPSWSVGGGGGGGGEGLRTEGGASPIRGLGGWRGTVVLVPPTPTPRPHHYLKTFILLLFSFNCIPCLKLNFQFSLHLFYCFKTALIFKKFLSNSCPQTISERRILFREGEAQMYPKLKFKCRE